MEPKKNIDAILNSLRVKSKKKNHLVQNSSTQKDKSELGKEILFFSLHPPIKSANNSESSLKCPGIPKTNLNNKLK